MTTTAAIPTIDMKPIESSQIHSIGYNPKSGILAIRFKAKDGAPTSLYHYRNVTVEDFAAFNDAESIGSHFYKHIKPFADKYPYVKVESAPLA